MPAIKGRISDIIELGVNGIIWEWKKWGNRLYNDWLIHLQMSIVFGEI